MNEKKVCPECGHVWDESVRFCGNCGTNITEVKTVADTQVSNDETSENKTCVDTQEDMVKETGPFTTERQESTNISSLTKKLTGNKKALAAVIIAAIALVAFSVSGITNNQYVTYTAGPFEYSFFDDAEINPQTHAPSSSYDYLEASCSDKKSSSCVLVSSLETESWISAKMMAEEMAKNGDRVIKRPMKDNHFKTDNSKFIRKKGSLYDGFHIFHPEDGNMYIVEVESADRCVVNDVLNSLKFDAMFSTARLTPLKRAI